MTFCRPSHAIQRGARCVLVIRLASGAPPVLTAARPSALPRTSPGALGPPFPSGVALPGAPLPVAPARALVVLTLDVPIARPAGEVRARRQASGKAQQGVDGPCARPDVCPTPSRPLCRLPRPARIPPHAPPCFRPPLPLPPAAVARRPPPLAPSCAPSLPYRLYPSLPLLHILPPAPSTGTGLLARRGGEAGRALPEGILGV